MSLHEVKSEVSPSLLRQAADKWENQQNEIKALRYALEEKDALLDAMAGRLYEVEGAWLKAMDELAAEADGRRIVLPCKVGDLVWGIRVHGAHKDGRKTRAKPVLLPVHDMYFGEDMRLCIVLKGCCRGEWGKAVFGTEEEALKSLEGRHEYIYDA